MRLLASLFLLLALTPLVDALIVPLSAANPANSLQGYSLTRLSDDEAIDLGEALMVREEANKNKKTLLVLGSHTADFNMVEYGQRIRFAWPKLKEKGVDRCLVVMNGPPSACTKLVELLDLPSEWEFFADPSGEAGRLFGVSRGWRPDDANIPPVLKTTVVGLGFGPPWMTLPAVLPGYFGNPWGKRDWIEESLKQGQLAGRWPQVLELSETNEITGNKFDNFPLLNSWGRRPFELATLRLQNLLDVQIKHWDELKPVDDRCLTQLGGCVVTDSDGKALYSWVDRGLCDVPDMDSVLEALS